MVEQSFEVEGEKVTLRATEPAASGDEHVARVPVVYLHVFEADGADVWQRLGEGGMPPMTLVAIEPRAQELGQRPHPVAGPAHVSRWQAL